MSSSFAYKMTITYDGTAYGGWQIQPNSITVQEILQEKLETILRHKVIVKGSGRTDAGVHALEQTTHFHTEQEVDIRRLKRSLNGMLPPDIRVLSIEPTTLDFHARFSAIGKIYRYHLALGKFANPFTRHYTWLIHQPFDMAKAKEAAQFFVGTHDFRTFANQRVAYEETDTVRTIHRIDLVETQDGLYIEFEGNGFLYKMVRNIVTIIVEVATGKRDIATIPKLFAARCRTAGGQVAPAQGLFLVKALY